MEGKKKKMHLACNNNKKTRICNKIYLTRGAGEK